MSRCRAAGAGAGNFYRCKLEDGHNGHHIPEQMSVNNDESDDQKGGSEKSRMSGSKQ